MIIMNILMAKVTKFVILDDEHKESFESSLFRERRPPHNSQAKFNSKKFNRKIINNFQ